MEKVLQLLRHHRNRRNFAEKQKKYNMEKHFESPKAFNNEIQTEFQKEILKIEGEDIDIEPYLIDEFRNFLNHEKFKEKTVEQYIRSLKMLFYHYDLYNSTINDDLANDNKTDNVDNEAEDEELYNDSILYLEYLICTNRDAAVKLLFDYEKMLDELKDTAEKDFNRSLLTTGYTAYKHYQKFIITLIRTQSPLLGDYLPEEVPVVYDFRDWAMFDEGVYLLEDFAFWLKSVKNKKTDVVAGYVSMIKRVYKNFFMKIPEGNILQDIPRMLDAEPKKLKEGLELLINKLKVEMVYRKLNMMSTSALASCKTVYAHYMEFILSLTQEHKTKRNLSRMYFERLIDNSLNSYDDEEEICLENDCEVYVEHKLDFKETMLGCLVGQIVASSASLYDTDELMNFIGIHDGYTPGDITFNKEHVNRFIIELAVKEIFGLMESFIDKLELDVDDIVKRVPNIRQANWLLLAPALHLCLIDPQKQIPILLEQMNCNTLVAEATRFVASIPSTPYCSNKALAEEIISIASEFDERVSRAAIVGCNSSLEELRAYHESKPGEVLHTLSLALWVFVNSKNYYDGLELLNSYRSLDVEQAISEGTNISSPFKCIGEYYDVFTLAGAMLGTKFGIYCISPRNVYMLTEIGKIFQLVDKLKHRTIDMLIKYEIKKKQESKTNTEQNEKPTKEV